MKYALDTLTIEYHRLLVASRKLDVEIGCGPNQYNTVAQKINDERLKEIETAIEALSKRAAINNKANTLLGKAVNLHMLNLINNPGTQSNSDAYHFINNDVCEYFNSLEKQKL